MGPFPSRSSKLGDIDLSSHGMPEALSSGTSHTCALTDRGLVICWGDDISGQSSGESTGFSSGPKRISLGGHATISISSGSNHSCALTADYSFGAGEYQDSQFQRGNRSLPTANKDFARPKFAFDFSSLRVLHIHAQFNSVSPLFVGAKITMVNWVFQSRPVIPGLVQSRTLPLHQHCHSGRATHAHSTSRGRSCVKEQRYGILGDQQKDHLTSL